MKKLEFGKDPELAKTEDAAGKLKGTFNEEAKRALRHGKEEVDLFGGHTIGGNSIRGRGRAEK